MSVVSVRAVSMRVAASLRLLSAVVEQVPDAVAELLAAGLEMRLRPPFRPRHRAARAGAIAQARRRIEHVPHLLGIVLPIGGEVQAPAGRELAHEQRGELRVAPGGACCGASCARDRGSRCGFRRASRRRSRAAALRPHRGGTRARGRCRPAASALSRRPTPGACTSMPIRSRSGSCCAAKRSASPLPKPISSTRLALAAEDGVEVARRCRCSPGRSAATARRTRAAAPA